MHSSRFLKIFPGSLLNQFCIIKWYAAVSSKFLSSVPAKTSRVMNSCDHKMQQIPKKKQISDVLQRTEIFGIADRKELKSDAVVHKNKREISIITKSNNSDTFGDIKDIHVFDLTEDKLGNESNFHEDCEIFIPGDQKYVSPAEYLSQMKAFVKEKKLKQALELFLDMKRHKVQPERLHYTFMIGACGRVGYTEMAFKLLRQMTDKGFKPTPATLTGLFNACAESPNVEYGLKKAKFLKEKVALKSWEIAAPTYRAMIKAFGKCGDIQTAFEIVDEMLESGYRISVEEYNALLISCITDKEAGFTHAVEVWRKMTSKKLCPNIFSFNLLLRAVRDCGAGPEEVSCNLLQHWSSGQPCFSYGRRKALSKEDVLSLPGLLNHDVKLLSGPVSVAGENVSSQGRTALPGKESRMEDEKLSGQDVAEETAAVCMNNADSTVYTFFSLLSPRPVDGPEFVDLDKIKNPSDRLLLIGGVKGVLELMTEYNVVPDIKTFTMLLKVIPDTTEHENELLSIIEGYNLKLDTDFFNILIKKRNFRKDFKSAKEALVIIAKRGLYPDVVTFGVLALGCTKKENGLQLLHDMKSLGFHPNIEIFGALLNSAIRSADFEYICTLLKVMGSEKIEPSPKFLQMLEDIKNTAREKILAVEQGKETTRLPFCNRSYNEFCKLYEQWLKSTNVEQEKDLWHQYKTEITERVREAPF